MEKNIYDKKGLPSGGKEGGYSEIYEHYNVHGGDNVYKFKKLVVSACKNKTECNKKHKHKGKYYK